MQVGLGNVDPEQTFPTALWKVEHKFLVGWSPSQLLGEMKGPWKRWEIGIWAAINKRMEIEKKQWGESSKCQTLPSLEGFAGFFLSVMM